MIQAADQAYNSTQSTMNYRCMSPQADILSSHDVLSRDRLGMSGFNDASVLSP